MWRAAGVAVSMNLHTMLWNWLHEPMVSWLKAKVLICVAIILLFFGVKTVFTISFYSGRGCGKLSSRSATACERCGKLSSRSATACERRGKLSSRSATACERRGKLSSRFATACEPCGKLSSCPATACAGCGKLSAAGAGGCGVISRLPRPLGCPGFGTTRLPTVPSARRSGRVSASVCRPRPSAGCRKRA